MARFECISVEWILPACAKLAEISMVQFTFGVNSLLPLMCSMHPQPRKKALLVSSQLRYIRTGPEVPLYSAGKLYSFILINPEQHSRNFISQRQPIIHQYD